MLRRIEGLSNVEYLGFQAGPGLTRLIAGARAVVVPSEWYENCPMSVLEAKALGRPVIEADPVNGVRIALSRSVSLKLYGQAAKSSIRKAWTCAKR